jgi:cytochrome c oxidase cbb3-type subunit I/II
MSDQKITIEFNDKVVRQFLLASVIWGAVGMVVGTLVAAQLNYWQVNFNLPWLTFGRLRPLHTNAVIFAFVGNMMFAGIYYSTQRLVKARLASDFLSSFISGVGSSSLWRRRSRSPWDSRAARNTRSSSGRSTSP